ncbi:MAG: hypothetical protein ABH851_06075 [Methanobacteriota archaeon]
MIEKTVYLLYGEDEVYVRLATDKKEVMDFAIVYYTIMDGEYHQVLRFDCEHGFAHKDIMYEMNPRKESLPDLSFKELANFAIDEIEKNWVQYKSQYLRNRKKVKYNEKKRKKGY